MEKLSELKNALNTADTILAEALKDPHLAKCPYIAAIRSGVNNGALARIEHLESWITENPAPPAEAAK
jgi:hypothetical protein